MCIRDSLSALHDVNIVTQTGYYDLTQGALALLSPADFAAAMVAIQSILCLLYTSCVGTVHSFHTTIWIG